MQSRQPGTVAERCRARRAKAQTGKKMANGVNAFSYLVGTLLDLYITALMLRLLLQWVRADFYNPVCQFLVKLTNPPLLPLRRVIPAIGRLDTATVVLML